MVMSLVINVLVVAARYAVVIGNAVRDLSVFARKPLFVNSYSAGQNWFHCTNIFDMATTMISLCTFVKALSSDPTFILQV